MVKSFDISGSISFKVRNLFREDVIGCRKDVGNERAVLDVLIITNDMNSVVTWLSRPITHITRAITFVITLNFSLRGALNGETLT